ncbi:perosamine synthetase [Pseudoalteromonas spongiae UST010723-006]|nr:perosamine synthetase [Pseudoalteromonas spongiae UST010723-006]
MINMAKPEMGEEEINAVVDVMKSGMIATGAVVADFEKKFADYIGMPLGAASCNGTTALHIALLALGIGEGDKVLTTPFTFIASSNSILFNRSVPVFVDIDPQTFTLDLDKLEAYLESNYDESIKAIMVVHIFGLACDMNRLQQIAKKYNLKVIEDCAQSHGALVNEQKAGSFGDASCFSFYPTKNMTTSEGGITLFKDEAVAALGRKYLNHGRVDQYEHDVLGYNYRMTNIAAAIGLEQLKKLEGMNDVRRRNAAIYNKELAGNPFIKTPLEPNGFKHVYHQYTVVIEGVERAEVQALLAENQIGSAIVYPFSITEQVFYNDKSVNVGDENARALSRKVLSLPVHPALSEEEVLKVCSVLNTLAKQV